MKHLQLTTLGKQQASGGARTGPPSSTWPSIEHMVAGYASHPVREKVYWRCPGCCSTAVGLRCM